MIIVKSPEVSMVRIDTRLALAAIAGAVVVAAVTDVQPRAIEAGGNWPQFRGPSRNGVSNETGLLQSWPPAGPPKSWTASGLGAGFSSVSIANGRVLTMGDRRDGQYVIALEEETGKQLWATRVGGRYDDDYSGPRSTPTQDGELAYTITTDGDLIAVETATGRIRWRKSLERDFGGMMMSGWSWAESPLVDGDRVVVTPGNSRAAIVALNKLTGADIWRATVPRLGSAGSDGAGYSSIVISNGAGVKQYVQMMGRGLVSVRASDGHFLWNYNRVANDTANIAMPVVSGDFVFGSTSYGAGSVMLELRPGANGGVTAHERYFLDGGTFQNHHGGFVLIGPYLYGGHGQSQGFPVCIEFATGRMMWERTRGPGSGSAAVIAADGRLYFRYQDGTMALIDPATSAFREVSKFTIPGPRTYSWSHPVIAAGRLYLREQDHLNVYNVKR
jgi:outer membrane protein assembly factor BamB